MANAQGAGTGPGNSRLMNTNLFKKPPVVKAPVVVKPKKATVTPTHGRAELEKEKLSMKAPAVVKKSPIAKKAAPAIHTRADLEKEKLAMKSTTVKKTTPAVHTRADLEKEKLAMKNAPKVVATNPSKVAAPKPTGGKTVTSTLPKVTAPTNTGKPGAVTNPSTTAPVVNNDRLNQLWAEANGYKNQISELLKNGFQYNPENDAAYKSLQTLAAKNAKAASGVAMEEMNDRGILNSTITSDRMGHIQQSAQDQVTAAVPQLQAQAYAQYSDKLSTLYNLMNTSYGNAENERNFGENQRQFNTSHAENVREFDLTRSDQNAQWQQGFQLDKDKFAFDKEQTKIDNALKQQGYDLESARIGLQELASIQDQGQYTDSKATQAVIAELLQNFTDGETAYTYFSQNSIKYYNAGINFNDVMTALDKRFKTSKSKDGGEISFK